jgi:hypothetical protein
LNANFPFPLAIARIVIDEDTHHMAVDELSQRTAARQNVDLVPLILLDELVRLSRYKRCSVSVERPDRN